MKWSQFHNHTQMSLHKRGIGHKRGSTFLRNIISIQMNLRKRGIYGFLDAYFQKLLL